MSKKKKKKKTETATDDTVSYAVNYTPGRRQARELKQFFLEGLQDRIRDLRDADSHVCPVDNRTTEDPDECTCMQYDALIDKIDEAKELLG